MLGAREAGEGGGEDDGKSEVRCFERKVIFQRRERMTSSRREMVLDNNDKRCVRIFFPRAVLGSNGPFTVTRARSLGAGGGGHRGRLGLVLLAVGHRTALTYAGLRTLFHRGGRGDPSSRRHTSCSSGPGGGGERGHRTERRCVSVNLRDVQRENNGSLRVRSDLAVRGVRVRWRTIAAISLVAITDQGTVILAKVSLTMRQ